jgi:hypothetical protein
LKRGGARPAGSKKLYWLSRTCPQRASKEAKVFWFFFSKKNILSLMFGGVTWPIFSKAQRPT